jgi:hypothetical protein
MQVFGTGQTSAHFGLSNCSSHCVHFFGLIKNASPFIEIAAFGHSNSQILQPVHWDATILYAIKLSSRTP